MRSPVALASCFAVVRAASYTIDSSVQGRRLDGYGSLSGGGATSRLLFQYPEQQLGEILDYLFLPNFGSSLHLLKVEIGGDGQSSEGKFTGTEPSHSHYSGDLNFNRGYEWRLMAEARKRNPDIVLGGLAWTWPGYVGAGTQNPWTNVTLSAGYIVDWVAGARDHHNISVDFIDADWNERSWSAPFVKELRRQLDAAGLGETKLVCGDQLHTFFCAQSSNTDPELAAAIYALGSHHPLADDPEADKSGKPLWGTELEVSDPGGSDMSTFYASLYHDINVTGFVLWNLVSAYNPQLFAPDQGIFRAWWPWNGHYELSGRTWVMAHYTQATRPGWLFLRQGSGSGLLSGGGAYTAFVDPPSGGFTIVIVKPAGGADETAQFTLRGPAAALTALHAVRSTVTRSQNPDTAAYFLAQPDVPVAGGVFSLTLRPGDMWTLSTLSTMRKGAAPVPPPAVPFPASNYTDDFDSCPVDQEAAYFTDMSGVWECTDSGDATRGIVMRQAVPAKPVTWVAETRPFTVFTATANLTDTDVTVDINLPKAGDAALLGARATPNKSLPAQNSMPGVWWQVDTTGAWVLRSAVAGAQLAAGTLAVAPAPGTWHTYRLLVSGNAATGFVDGVAAFTAVSVRGTPPAGFPGLGTGSWGQAVLFDRFALKA